MLMMPKRMQNKINASTSHLTTSTDDDDDDDDYDDDDDK